MLKPQILLEIKGRIYLAKSVVYPGIIFLSLPSCVKLAIIVGHLYNFCQLTFAEIINIWCNEIREPHISAIIT